MRPKDKVKVAVVIAACLIGLTVALKNVIAPPDILSRDIILWITIFSGFFIVLNFTEEAPATTSRKAYDSPWVWSVLIVGMTLAISAVYAFA